MRRSHMNMSQWSPVETRYLRVPISMRGPTDFWGMSRAFLGCYSWSWIDSWAYSQNFEGCNSCSNSQDL